MTESRNRKKTGLHDLSFLFRVVPRAGLEPARIAPHAPQTCAATNYATSARLDEAAWPNPSKINYFLGVGFAVFFGAAVFLFGTLAFADAEVFELAGAAFELPT